jgi:hypothetical protein
MPERLSMDLLDVLNDAIALFASARELDLRSRRPRSPWTRNNHDRQSELTNYHKLARHCRRQSSDRRPVGTPDTQVA